MFVGVEGAKGMQSIWEGQKGSRGRGTELSKPGWGGGAGTKEGKGGRRERENQSREDKRRKGGRQRKQDKGREKK